MTVIDVPAKIIIIIIKIIIIIIKIFFYFFLGSGSLYPMELRGVKRVGKHEKHCSSKKSARSQVHELLIRCF
jgi:hypothetical protein